MVEPNTEDIVAAAERLRVELRTPVLEPASLHIEEWSQADYLLLWESVIDTFAQRVVLMPGWQYSAGCASELVRAIKHGLPIEIIDNGRVSAQDALAELTTSIKHLHELDIKIPGIERAAEDLNEIIRPSLVFALNSNARPFRKDASLDQLAERINVAQFVSFSPGRGGQLRQEYSRVFGCTPNDQFPNARSAIATLLERSSEHAVNIRSYTPDNPQSREFIYGLTSVEDALNAAERLSSEGLYVITNETIDIHDGGVSGVLMGDVIEFAPDDTPRAVEKPGIASLPRAWGTAILATVYGFTPEFNVPITSRLEFSIHPKRRGWRNTHTIGWEYQELYPTTLQPSIAWPNRFSRILGDKVYGLLIAHHVGLPVPRTTVFNRRIAPFSFGLPTGSAEYWIRTSPPEQEPGKYTTRKGWIDPFHLLQLEDPAGAEIASVISQHAIPARFSGAALVTTNYDLLIEGVLGEGDAFMKGEVGPEALPTAVNDDVQHLYERARRILGPVRFEWVHDGQTPWIVQLHGGVSQSSDTIIVPGDPNRWADFHVERGLESLRSTLSTLESGMGILLHGSVGLTSHIADVIRRAGIPAKIAGSGPNQVEKQGTLSPFALS